MHLKISSAKWRPFCPCRGDGLTLCTEHVGNQMDVMDSQYFILRLVSVGYPMLLQSSVPLQVQYICKSDSGKMPCQLMEQSTSRSNQILGGCPGCLFSIITKSCIDCGQFALNHLYSFYRSVVNWLMPGENMTFAPNNACKMRKYGWCNIGTWSHGKWALLLGVGGYFVKRRTAASWQKVYKC